MILFFFIIVGLLSLLAGLGNHLNWLEFFSHFQVIIFALNLLAFLISTHSRYRGITVLLAAMSLYHLIIIAPYFGDLSRQPDSQQKLSVLLYNMNANNPNYPEIIATIENIDPDVFVICEVNHHLTDRMRKLHQKYPHRIGAGRWPGSTIWKSSGTILWSKIPFKNSEVEPLTRSKILVLDVCLDWYGKEIQILTSHPQSPLNQRQTLLRNLSYQEIIPLIDESQPTILAGDLNNTVWAAELRRFSKITHLKSAYLTRGLRATWPAPIYPLGIGIDHFYHSEEISVRDLRSLPGCGSDHRMLYCEFIIESS
ncbi:MAG: endonuclease/exonuclease/phosphatase family protein [Opitutales bacterium]|nr:endonuclease/exonuclease/phosphatase family protein [Opitutales bacterium]